MSTGSVERCMYSKNIVTWYRAFFNMETPDWYKIKGYYHFSSQISSKPRNKKLLIYNVQNPDYIANYSFFPLLHTNIKERRFKPYPYKEGKNDKPIKTHSFFDKEKNKFVKNIKVRPLHYANHKDAVIYGYYAHLLSNEYEKIMVSHPLMNSCITAYRKIRIPGEFKKNGGPKNKGSVHFAAEVFEEIKRRVNSNNECSVLAFDIKSFFSSLDHAQLEHRWRELLGKSELPSDHYNVFKSVTEFSFVYKDDLRKHPKKSGRRANFNEKKIAQNRNLRGIHSFFASPADFRNEVKSGKLRVYKNNFKNGQNEMIGIPQGLPISAILANIYLYEFDKAVFENLVLRNDCYYRRYSDDIIIICPTEIQKKAEDFIVSEMQKSKVKISEDKTEKFIFKIIDNKIVSHSIDKNGNLNKEKPLTYLGFEFYGYKTLIKSSNLSKFYRRMIYSVKRKSKIAKKIADQKDEKPIIYKRQLYPLYRNIDLNKKKTATSYKTILKLPNGEYRTIMKEKDKKHFGNYFSYVRRSAEILKAPEILEQIRNEKKIFNEALRRRKT